MDRTRAVYFEQYGLRGIMIVMIMATAVFSGSCLFETKTNLCEISGRRCLPGETCAADQDVCILIGGCGDGVVQEDEVCDDGNIRNNDNCSHDCMSNTACGNGAVDPDEDCDTGAEDSPGCDANCTFAMCGDGYMNAKAGEDCDSRGLLTVDCNGLFCKFSECGDNYYNPNDNEVCDTGGNTLACDVDCTVPECGDGILNQNYIIPEQDHMEECDDGNSVTTDACPQGGPNGTCENAFCGDGFIYAGMEECDDGNNVTTDACPRGGPGGTCKSAFCGDSFTYVGMEECDDGNGVTTDACPRGGPGGTCKSAFCGDGFTHAGMEECDDGNSVTTDACPQGGPGGCKSARCGDGFIHATVEACDKGASLDEDGCPTNKMCNPNCTACI